MGVSLTVEEQELLGPLPGLPAAPRVVTVPTTRGDMAIGAFEAADRFDQQTALWNPQIASADRDYLPEMQTIDSRARDMVRNDAYVQGASNLHKDNIVGSQFLLNARPASRVLFGKVDDGFEEAFQAEVEEKFDLYAESPDNWIDAQRINNFTSLVRLAVGIHLAAGEVLSTVEWDRTPGRPYRTAIQMIDLDRLETMPESRLDNSVRAGVRRDRYGAPVAYQIRTRHPVDYGYDFKLPEWKEVAVRKPWGRLQVIHLYEQMRPDQTRGIPEVAAALSEMHITKKFRALNLQNAVTQALYAAAITSDLPSETVFAQLGGTNAGPEQVQKMLADYAAGYWQTINKYAAGSKNLQIDGVRIPHLFPGTKLDILTPGKGGPLGTEFEESLLRYIAASLGVSYEQLSRDYTKTNYSSARAAMTETWKFMQARKKAVADRFASIIYRLWLEEALNNGLIESMPADARSTGWLYEGPRLDAISRCEWIGASRGQIDELKETEAAVLRIRSGLSTWEDELARLGKDWRKVFRQRLREQQLQKDLGVDFSTEKGAASSAANDQPQDQQNAA